MIELVRSPSFLPSCILAGVGLLFLVLASTLPPVQAFALIGGSVVGVGVVVARLRRQVVESGPIDRAARSGVEG